MSSKRKRVPQHKLEKPLTSKQKECKLAKRSEMITSYWLRKCKIDEHSIEKGIIDFIIIFRGFTAVRTCPEIMSLLENCTKMTPKLMTSFHFFQRLRTASAKIFHLSQQRRTARQNSTFPDNYVGLSYLAPHNSHFTIDN